MLKMVLQTGSLFLIAAIWFESSVHSQSQQDLSFDFSVFDESKWIEVRDSKVKDIGSFVQKNGYIQNFVKEEHIGKHTLAAGHALRLAKNCSFENGHIETELMLVGRAAPSIYFRTQIEGEIHKETYNLVVFDFSNSKRKHYYGLNLWKWKENLPARAKRTSNWLKLASWTFPVPIDEKIKIAVEADGPYIKVYFNDQLKGTVYDSEPLGEGHVGICSCEGVNNFYSFNVQKK